ncbi:MAG: hypothetical protein ACRDJ9_24560, partial [Dehalococcoidia bacterium]
MLIRSSFCSCRPGIDRKLIARPKVVRSASYDLTGVTNIGVPYRPAIEHLIVSIAYNARCEPARARGARWLIGLGPWWAR